jgi:hypothetical protein
MGMRNEKYEIHLALVSVENNRTGSKPIMAVKPQMYLIDS